YSLDDEPLSQQPATTEDEVGARGFERERVAAPVRGRISELDLQAAPLGRHSRQTEVDISRRVRFGEADTSRLREVEGARTHRPRAGAAAEEGPQETVLERAGTQLHFRVWLLRLEPKAPDLHPDL